MISKYTYQLENTIVKEFVIKNIQIIQTQLLQIIPDKQAIIHLDINSIINGADLNIQNYLQILDHYNYFFRIPQIYKKYLQSDEVLPQPTPIDYVNHKRWEKQQKLWIGHGYYWKRGQTQYKDIQGAGDFDSIQSNFYKIQNSKVLVADYKLIKKDFPGLADFSNEEINNWIINNCAYLSEGQVHRIKHQLKQFLEVQPNIKLDQKKIGIRYRGGGRAAGLIVSQNYNIHQNDFNGNFINIKGIGTDITVQEIGIKQNGFLSKVDAIKQYFMQKLIQKIADKEKAAWGTIQTYAIIDIHMKFKENIQNPATGYLGDRFALTLRQSSSRLSAGYDQVAYYSVATVQQMSSGTIRNFIDLMRDYHISCEKSLNNWRNHKHQFNLEGEYNIQTDATLKKLVDFSQYYISPFSKLPEMWKMSMQGLIQGLKCNSIFMKQIFLQKNIDNLKFLFKQCGEEELQEIYNNELIVLKQKYGDYAGKYIKSKYSWSWHLQTDDSLFGNEIRSLQKLDYQEQKAKIEIMKLNFLEKLQV